MTFVKARAAALLGTLALAFVCEPGHAQDAAKVAQGKGVFAHYCAPCHGDGRGDDGAPMLPGTHALQLKYRGQKPSLLEQRTDLPDEFVRAIVRNGVASMPPFRKTELTDEDIAAIAAYLAASARGTRR